MEYLIGGIIFLISSLVLSLCKLKIIDIFIAIIGTILIFTFLIERSNKIIIKEYKEKTIKEYLQNKVDIQYKGVQTDSIFVITDTIITFK